MAVPDNGKPKKRETEVIIIDKWPEPTEFGSWEISFESEVTRSSQYPRAGMQWIGEDEDAKSMDDLLIT